MAPRTVEDRGYSVDNLRMHPPCTLLLLLALTGRLCVALCPFPGIPAHATARIGRGATQQVTWSRGISFKEGEIVTFNCDDHRAIASSEKAQIRCRNDGTWDGTSPRCDRTSNWKDWKVSNGEDQEIATQSTCSSPASDRWSMTWASDHLITEIRLETCPGEGHLLSVATSVDGQLCHRINDTLLFNCRPKQVANGRKVEINFESPIRLSSVSVLVNERNNCGAPPVPLNAHIKHENVGRVIKSVTFECDHQLQWSTPKNHVQCNQFTGQWTALPNCVAPCARPRLSDFISVQSHGPSSFSYECKRPLIGSGRVTCDASGKLVTHPQCACADPVLAPHVEVAHKTAKMMTLECPEYMELTSSGDIFCHLEDGKWKTRINDTWADALPECTCNTTSANVSGDTLNDQCVNAQSDQSAGESAHLTGILVTMGILAAIGIVFITYRAKSKRMWCFKEEFQVKRIHSTLRRYGIK